MAKTPKKTPAKKAKKKTEKPEAVDENSVNISVEEAATPPAEGQAAEGQPVGGADIESGDPLVSVLAQYTKDMSFENPSAPGSLRAGQATPEVNIDMSINRTVNQDNTIEVSILIKAHATREGATLFIAELDYAGLFVIQNVGMEQIQPLMMIECPRIIFPYARKILADMTQDGGHMPIMLDMPDFASMFREEMMRRAQEQGLN